MTIGKTILDEWQKAYEISTGIDKQINNEIEKVIQLIEKVNEAYPGYNMQKPKSKKIAIMSGLRHFSNTLNGYLNKQKKLKGNK